MDNEAKLKQIIDVLDQLSEDTSVPRNIRRGATSAKERLLQTKEALDVRAASAITILDDLANDRISRSTAGPLSGTSSASWKR